MPRLSPQQLSTLAGLSEVWAPPPKYIMGTTLRSLKRMGLADKRVVGRKSSAVVQWRRTPLGTLEVVRVGAEEVAR